MNNIQKIDEQLSKFKLIRKEIPKDGACMFRCISEFIYGTQSRHQYVRDKCVDYLVAHRDVFEPFACINNPWDKYIQEMRKPDTWGGEIELQASSLYFKVNFIIYIGINTTKVENNYKTTISLAYCQGEHYDLVYPIQHMENLKNAQSLVYQILYERLQIECVDEMFNWRNNPIIWWDELVKVKQEKDKKIVDSLKINTRIYVDPVEEYQLKLKKKQKEEEEEKKKKQQNNNQKNNNKQQNGGKSRNINSSNDKSQSPSPPTSQSSTPPSVNNNNNTDILFPALENNEEIDDELKELIKQIELQDLEEQRRLGREKHFPTLGSASVSSSSSKSNTSSSSSSSTTSGSRPQSNLSSTTVKQPALTILPDPVYEDKPVLVTKPEEEVGSPAWRTAQLWSQLSDPSPPPRQVDTSLISSPPPVIQLQQPIQSSTSTIQPQLIPQPTTTIPPPTSSSSPSTSKQQQAPHQQFIKNNNQPKQQNNNQNNNNNKNRNRNNNQKRNNNNDK